MHNVAKLVALDMGALYSGTHKYRWWSYLVAFLIVLIAFLNGDAATPLAGAITGTSVGILMMPFASVDRHGLEQLGTIPCQVDTYKNENTIFLIRPNRGNIPPRFGHFF